MAPQRQFRQQHGLVLHEGGDRRIASGYRDSGAHQESEESRQRDALPPGELREQRRRTSRGWFFEGCGSSRRLGLSRVLRSSSAKPSRAGLQSVPQTGGTLG